MEELDIIGRNIGVTFDGNPVFVLSEPILSIAPTNVPQNEKIGTWGKSADNMELSFSVPINEFSPNIKQLLLSEGQSKVKVVWTKECKKKLHKLFTRMCKQYKRKDAARV